MSEEVLVIIPSEMCSLIPKGVELPEECEVANDYSMLLESIEQEGFSVGFHVIGWVGSNPLSEEFDFEEVPETEQLSHEILAEMAEVWPGEYLEAADEEDAKILVVGQWTMDEENKLTADMKNFIKQAKVTTVLALNDASYSAISDLSLSSDLKLVDDQELFQFLHDS